MASAFTHAAAALALGTAFRPPAPPARFWIAGAACALVPDLDLHVLGHRGLSHSLAFAVVLAAAVTWMAGRGRAWHGRRASVGLFIFLATASHGILDAMTDGGPGVAFFAPFDDGRYFLPWRPIPVSPLGLRFFSARGVDVVKSELIWVWLPAAILAAGCILVRGRGTK